MLAKQIDQSDMLAKHNDSMDKEFKSTNSSKQRTRTKVMSKWLTHQDTYP
jgi:uncharacterized protein YxjI